MNGHFCQLSKPKGLGAVLQVTLCGKRKMDEILLLASYVARLLVVVAANKSVFPYVPEVGCPFLFVTFKGKE
jgi:hypothetical protein